ncbi:MAG: acetyl-CoA carboxylase, carboxyltransferase subunit beta [Chlamydiales bacterium]|nr:acetyl-CoA carboxylase, carboxyltransferase subunit beta [Chlamydiales bacterium]
MGLFSRNKAKIKITATKKDGFSGWLKCTHCSELIHANELEGNKNCCPKCNYHYRLSADDRINLLADTDSFVELFQGLEAVDALSFVDSQPYHERIDIAKNKSGREEACVVGTCTIHSNPVALGVMDFGFMGGSMGSVVGEKLTRLIEYATAKRIPLIIVSISGGARMQESIFSLMQMAKTSAALARLQERQVPYISVLTNPTTGGVTASFASLGDIIIAEPNALICFAGPRVIEQILGKPLPEGAQQSEFLLNHGLIDIITPRHELKDTLGCILGYVHQKPTVFDDKKPSWRKTA